ncbi:trypsin-like serine protease [Bdellovibrio sp. NC01]|uniref:S1 family peptidase n=1 Tax=Bdellovibrio sp. NC01 TaxID=2220073 RepID=UPI00115C1880|nr:trypsin-like serine protease [Bdellovibrio sp. NC01]QDK38144.1 serine protease [Bdellovibrio sp. NC01]
MKSLKYLLVSSLLVAACSDKSAQNSTEVSANGSIVGGKEVQPGDREMTSTVGLYDTEGKFLCTGTLISANLVLTAGHCIGEKPEKMIVIFKENFNDLNKDNTRPVVGAVRHKDYDPKRGTNTADIAVIRFDNTVPVPAGYKTAKLLPDFNLLQKGTSVVVAGYGLNWSWVIKKGSGVLRTTELQVKDPNWSETELSLSQSVKRGICSGDSGGPGYLDIDGQLYVWGVVSRGDSLPIPLTPDCFIFSVYTRIDAYKTFIVEAAAELNK